jgi:hypothetical protein
MTIFVEPAVGGDGGTWLTASALVRADAFSEKGAPAIKLTTTETSVAIPVARPVKESNISAVSPEFTIHTPNEPQGSCVWQILDKFGFDEGLTSYILTD